MQLEFSTDGLRRIILLLFRERFNFLQLFGYFGSVLQLGYRGGLISRYNAHVSQHSRRAHPRHRLQTNSNELIQCCDF